MTIYNKDGSEKRIHMSNKRGEPKEGSVSEAKKFTQMCTFSEIPEVNRFFQSLGRIYHDGEYQLLVEEFYKWQHSQFQASNGSDLQAKYDRLKEAYIAVIDAEWPTDIETRLFWFDLAGLPPSPPLTDEK